MQFLEISVMNGIRDMCAWLCQFIYKMVAWVYELFINISRVEILSTDDIQPMYERLTMILAIVMVFYVTFEFVKYVIQPDTFSDKEKGAQKIVAKMLIVVVLIAFVPQIFSWSYKLQNKIFDTQILSKVILGKSGIKVNEFGRTFSSNLFGMFYYVDESIEWKNEDVETMKCGDLTCKQVVSLNLENLGKNGEMPYLTMGLNEKGKTIETDTGETVEKYKINFDSIFAIVVGGFVAYMLILYCVDAGVRIAQLAFLQIIAPIPIIGYLSPKKDGIFQKWGKQCLTTYLDLFIRMAIIYFILFVCQMLGNAFSDGSILQHVESVTSTMKVFMYVAIIMGLLMFAKKAPKMLGELFPKMGAASGNFGLKAGDRGLDKLFGGALGVASGAAWGVATGTAQGWRRFKGTDGNIGKRIASGVFGASKGVVGGAVGGSVRGLYHGAKKGNPIKNGFAGAKSQAKANQRFGNREEAGYSMLHQAGDAVRSAFHMPSRVEELENKKAPLKRHQDINEKIRKANSDMTAEAESQVKKGKGRYSGELAVAEKRLQNLQDNQNLKSETKNKLKNKLKESDESIKEDLAQIEAWEKMQDGEEKEKNRKNIEDKKEKVNEKLDKMVTDEMVEKDISKQLTEAQKAVKNAKDLAIFDFITNGEYNASKGEYSTNAKIESIRAELRTEMTEYNKYNTSAEYAINQELVETAMMDGEILDTLVKGKTIGSLATLPDGTPKQDSEGNDIYLIEARNSDGTIKKDKDGKIVYLEYIPNKHGTNKALEKNQNRLIEITQQQEAIKRETSGSGIGEGKK